MVITGFKVIKDFADFTILFNQETDAMLVYAP
jgi:sRNA-binding regulator protein Hfq